MDGPGFEIAAVRRLARSRWSLLVLLCAGANVVETLLVAAFAHGARPDLASQATAVAPFGVLHDLRWVSVYHNSWATFAAEVVAMVVVRGLLTGASVALAWPAHVSRPSPARLATRGIGATVISALLLAPSATLLFALAVVPVSWLFFAAVPAALLVALIIYPVAADGAWWRHSVPLRGIGWIVFSFAVITAASVVMNHVPVALWPLVAAATGLFNAWAWVGVVAAVVDRQPRPAVPVAPAGIAALVAVVILGTVTGFGHARASTQPLRTLDAAPHAALGPPLLVVSGYGSTWDGVPRHPIPGDFVEQRFSYSGLGPGAEPLAYSSADTVKPLAQLDRMLVGQVQALSASTGARVGVVAESEGALVAKTALLEYPVAPVSTLVMASPLLEPGRVSYPTPGSSGWGLASGTGMQLLSDAFQSVSPIDLSPDSAFLRGLDSAGPDLEAVLPCAIPNIRQFALLPLADAVADPEPASLAYPSVVVAAFHGGLLESPDGGRLVASVLDSGGVQPNGLLQAADEAIRSGASAWLAPSLADSDRPASSLPTAASAACSPSPGSVGR